MREKNEYNDSSIYLPLNGCVPTVLILFVIQDFQESDVELMNEKCVTYCVIL